MNKGKSANVAVDEEGTSPAVPQAVAGRELGRPVSGVQIVARASRPPEVGSATLKQNAALMERLRQVAMRSEPPLDPPPPRLRAAEPEEPTTNVRVPRLVVPDALALASTSRAFDLVTPRREEPKDPLPPPARFVVEEPTAAVPAHQRAARRARRLRVAGIAAVVAVLAAAAVGFGARHVGAESHASTTSRAP